MFNRISFLALPLICLCLVACCLDLQAQPNGERPLFESSLLIAPRSFTNGVEGPSVDTKGNVYAVNFARQGTIGMVTPEGKGELFVSLPGGSIANGSRFINKKCMLLADYTNHNVYELNIKTRKLKVLAHAPQMTQPNDLAVDSRGHVYASDPNFKAGSGRVWLISKQGEVSMLDSLGPANGIEVSPDEKTLYVGAARTIWKYRLANDGTISDKQMLIEFPDFGTDGMRCDVEGNLYVARIGKGVVAQVSPGGQLIREVRLTGSKPTNVAFGGADGKTVYVTLMDQGNIEWFRTDIPGREWKMQHQ